MHFPWQDTRVSQQIINGVFRTDTVDGEIIYYRSVGALLNSGDIDPDSLVLHAPTTPSLLEKYGYHVLEKVGDAYVVSFQGKIGMGVVDTHGHELVPIGQYTTITAIGNTQSLALFTTPKNVTTLRRLDGRLVSELPQTPGTLYSYLNNEFILADHDHPPAPRTQSLLDLDGKELVSPKPWGDILIGDHEGALYREGNKLFHVSCTRR